MIFLIPCIVVVPLLFYSFCSSEEPSNPLINFSLTDLGLIGLAIYAVLKKPWKENLAGHFKTAYRNQIKSIQKTVKERDRLREEVNTLTIFHQTYSSLEKVEEAMRAEDGFPPVNDMGKQLWDGNRNSLCKGLEDIENIKNSEDAKKILSYFSQMDYISQKLFEEVMRLRELKSLSKTGKISGSVFFNKEFAEDYPEQPQFHISVRLKPEYIQDGYISQFWLSQNPFYPNDPNTGKKVEKRNLSVDNRWWLITMNSPYWKYVEFIDFNFENSLFINRDGRHEIRSPEDYQLPDGTKLSDWKNKMFLPLKFEKDGEW